VGVIMWKKGKEREMPRSKRREGGVGGWREEGGGGGGGRGCDRVEKVEG